MQDALKKYNVACLWHFTDKRNLESIKQHGLLSWKELSRRDLEPTAPGGNDWSHKADKRSNVDDYVHLSFVKDHPMLHVATKEERIVDHVWLQIDLSVINADTRYTNAVANQANVQLLDNKSAVDQVDLEAIFKYIDFKIPGNLERKRAAAKSEVMIPTMIGIDKIKGF